MRSLDGRIRRIQKRHAKDIAGRREFRRLLKETWEAGPESWNLLVDVIGEVLPQYGAAMTPTRLQMYRDLGPPAVSRDLE